jgi:hypothetical protein
VAELHDFHKINAKNYRQNALNAKQRRRCNQGDADVGPCGRKQTLQFNIQLANMAKIAILGA